MDTPTLAAYQTLELSSGGGDTRLVRTHSALHIPGNRGFPRADLGNLHDLVLGVNVSETGSMDLDTLLSRISRLSVVSRQLLRFEWAIMDGQETTHATFPGRNPYGKQLLEAHIAAHIITLNYGGLQKRTGFNFLAYTESNSTRRIKLRVR
jgi:hypothetical protein